MTAPDPTLDRLEAAARRVRETHMQTDAGGYCNWDGEEWPCQAAQMADGAPALIARLRRLETVVWAAELFLAVSEDAVGSDGAHQRLAAGARSLRAALRALDAEPEAR